jgi:hypothetical protein
MSGQQNILTGAGCKVAINGIVIGFATGINWTRSAGTKPIYEIDNNLIVDQIDTTFIVTGSMTGFRLRGVGNLEAQSIVGLDNVQNIFKRNFCSIQVIDRTTGNTIANINNVMFDNDSWSVGAKSVIGFNVQFKGQFVASEKS